MTSRAPRRSCVARTADVDPGRPIEQDGLDPVLERHRRRHMQDDRDGHAVRFIAGQAGPLRPAPGQFRALELEAGRVARDTREPDVVPEGRHPQHASIERPAFASGERGSPAYDRTEWANR